MIIQCEQCQAKFKLDDSKITDKGVKVRCAKCKHVFTVTREQSAPEPVASGFSPELSADPQQEDYATRTPAPQQQPELSTPFSVTPDFQEVCTARTAGESSGVAGSGSTFALSGNDEFGISSFEGDVARDTKSSGQGEVDFDSFDFGEDDSVGKTKVAPASQADFSDTLAQVSPAVLPEKKEEPKGLDFSDDDMFGAVVQSPVEEPAESISFDFGTDSFEDSLGMGSPESSQKGSSITLDGAADAPFSLGEIDFGDELTSVAVQQVNPDELKPSQEILFAPLAEAQEKPEPETDDEIRSAFMPFASQAAKEDDLPPLTITSRRRQSPLFTGLIAAAVLLVVGALGYFGFSAFKDDKGKPAHDVGRINLRQVKASYVRNAVVGNMLVISGEAVNEYSAPRAALQVKGMVYDAKGQVLTSKNAYGGNIMTDEQLATLPLDKIETAMANQFGDSLTNMEVAPGKKVLFMVVIANPPVDGKDFGVESAGSTVAAAKQKQ